MKGESILGESGPFAPRKIVGRPASAEKAFWQTEQIRMFTKKFTRGMTVLSEAELREILKREGNR